jgi:hypothetical protein
MSNTVSKVAMVQMRPEYIMIDQPSRDNLASEQELLPFKERFSLTSAEAQILWFLRSREPIDLSLIVTHRTHMYNLRRKIKPFNMDIKNLFRGVYQLSVVEEISDGDR